MNKFVFLVVSTLALVVIYFSTITNQRRFTRDNLQSQHLHYTKHQLDSIKVLYIKVTKQYDSTKADSSKKSMIYLMGYKDCLENLVEKLATTMENDTTNGKRK